MKQYILIVDDDPGIGEILAFNLRNEGYEVEYASSAETALQMLAPRHALILLDVMMGGMSGYKMAEHLRSEGNAVPIIFLTAKNTENDLLTAFSVGADDFLSKPFSIKALLARVKAVLKRTASIGSIGGAPTLGTVLSYGSMDIDLESMELHINKESIPLTKTEFKLLLFLAQQPHRVFSREEIIEQVWSETPYITLRSVDVHITRLRKKLGEHASVIVNKAGYGYRFDTSAL
ncbi:MAG: response regulator transcription factor [Bacteroides sp.]|nr:response regulator transcription factor [Bacteroides sp.]